MRYTDDQREVECVLTPIRFEQARDALASAFCREFARPIDIEALAVLLAQSALETGRWQKIYCFNLGNKKASLNYAGMHCYFPPGTVNERLNGQVHWFDPPHPQTRFRAYATARDGAIAYLRFLGVDTNGGGNYYQAAWDAAMAGDAYAYATELARLGYYTAELTRYRAGVVQIAEEYRGTLAGYSPVAPEPEEAATPIVVDAIGEELRRRVRMAQADVTDRALRGELSDTDPAPPPED